MYIHLRAGEMREFFRSLSYNPIVGRRGADSPEKKYIYLGVEVTFAGNPGPAGGLSNRVRVAAASLDFSKNTSSRLYRT